MKENVFQIKKRKLTAFQFQQMSYEFITQRLDGQSRLAVEEFIEENPEYAESLEALSVAIRYCNDLGQAKLSDSFQEEVEKTEPFFAKTKEFFSKMFPSELLKWGLVAAIISVFVAVLIILLPWQRLL